MTRRFYRLILALHPARFAARFRDEMLSIFEEPGGPARLTLLGDGLVSLARQWMLRMGGWKVAAAILCALAQFWGFSWRKAFFQPGKSRAAATPEMEQLILLTLGLVCGLSIFIMSLALWTMRFQRRRNAGLRVTRARG